MDIYDIKRPYNSIDYKQQIDKDVVVIQNSEGNRLNQILNEQKKSEVHLNYELYGSKSNIYHDDYYKCTPDEFH